MADWTDFLSGGLNAIIDSQQAQNYSAPDPTYNTQNGVAGQSQQPSQIAQLTSNPIALIAVIGVVALVVYLIARK